MKINRLFAVPTSHWLILAALLSIPAIGVVSVFVDDVSASLAMYVLQPLIAISIAGFTRIIIGPSRARARHTTEKAYMVAAIIALWFVVYFLSGLILTFVRNSLVTGFWPVVANVAAFGVTALAVEYVRYLLMGSVSRRLIVPFGVVVAISFAFIIMPINQLTSATSVEVAIKVITATVVPAFASSLLLTYLAVAAGFGSMLVYRLGIVAIGLLPPIIPNYDWYLIGISSLVLVIAVYLVVDSMLQEQSTRTNRHYRLVQRASNTMYVLVMIAVVSFMTGVFSYRPIAIVSNSMQPVYSRGAMVVIQRVDESMDIEVGDIVQYQTEGKTITHRVVAVDAASDGSGKRVYTTKGDNSPSRDPIISREQIVGVVRAQVPYIGYPTVWLREAAL